MKQILFTTVMVLLLASCGGKEQNSAEAIDNELNEMVESDEYQENGLNKLRPQMVDADADNGTYHVTVAVSPDESLPHVPNDNFGTYCDNRATVIACNQTDTLLNRQFVKDDFSNFLDENLKTNAILDNVAIVSATPQALTLDASVSVPHSDEQAIITVTIGLAGGVSMEKNNASTDAFVDEEAD